MTLPKPAESGAEWGELGRRLEFLRGFALFAACSPDTLTHVAAALQQVTLPEGAIICQQGDPGDTFYLLQSGTASVEIQVGEQRVTLAELGPGAYFGEQSLVSPDNRRTASVRAASAVSLWSLAGSEFREVLARERSVARAIGQVDQERTSGRELLAESVERRLVATLPEAGGAIRIGSAPDNELILDSLNVSPHHAVLEKEGQTVRLRDLKSDHGTFINGRRIETADLRDGDEIQLAGISLDYANGEIRRRIEPDGVNIELRDVNKVVTGGKQLLHNISLQIHSGDLVAIVGGSGAGKTTLMDAISGIGPATSGTITYNGRDYYAERDHYRSILGYVPQDDVIHTELAVVNTLNFAARLRLPVDSDPGVLRGVVEQTLKQLNLEANAASPVRKLSGGQRKRASIGVELLTKPRVFFLDEPTSGLDPATETQMMRLMRHLADQGATVITTTHATKNLLQCDKVIFLAQGGYLAFAGSPQRALQYFGARDFDEIYEMLQDTSTPEEWAQRFRSVSGAPPPSTASGDQAEQAAPSGTTARSGVIPARPSPHPFHQFVILTQRSYAILRQDPANLFALFVQPFAVTLLLLALFKAGTFAPGTMNPAPAIETLMVLSFAMFFFGVSFGLNEICQEYVIFLRERMVNLGVGPYVLSKVAVFGPFLLLTDAIILAALRLTDRLPADSLAVYARLYLTLGLCEFAGLAMGLFVSAIVPNPDIATRVLPIVLLPQALFSGGFVGRPSMGIVGQWIGDITVMRWAFEGAGKVLNVNSFVPKGLPPDQNPLLLQYGDAFSRDPWQNWAILAAYVVVPLSLACLILSRRARR